jgi:predicted ester cyclase
MDVERYVAEGDKVAARFTIRGTHDGPFFGVPPTGQTIVGMSTSFYRIVDGKIAEDHGLADVLGILQQIGAFPSATICLNLKGSERTLQ